MSLERWLEIHGRASHRRVLVQGRGRDRQDALASRGSVSCRAASDAGVLRPLLRDSHAALCPFVASLLPLLEQLPEATRQTFGAPNFEIIGQLLRMRRARGRPAIWPAVAGSPTTTSCCLACGMTIPEIVEEYPTLSEEAIGGAGCSRSLRPPLVDGRRPGRARAGAVLHRRHPQAGEQGRSAWPAWRPPAARGHLSDADPHRPQRAGDPGADGPTGLARPSQPIDRDRRARRRRESPVRPGSLARHAEGCARRSSPTRIAAASAGDARAGDECERRPRPRAQ